MSSDASQLAAQLAGGGYARSPQDLHKALFLAQLVSLRETGEPFFYNTIVASAQGPFIPNLLPPAQSHYANDPYVIEFLYAVGGMMPWGEADLNAVFQGPLSCWSQLYQPEQNVEIPIEFLLEKVNDTSSEESKIADYVLNRLEERAKKREQVPQETIDALLDSNIPIVISRFRKEFYSLESPSEPEQQGSSSLQSLHRHASQESQMRISSRGGRL